MKDFKEQDRKVVAVPAYYIRHCIEKTEDEEHKKYLESLLEQIDDR